MKKFILLFIPILLIASNSFAKIWRVNNQSNYDGSTLWGENFGGTASYPVFKQIYQAASYSFVNDGDTLYVEGSTITYSETSISKRLVIIGAGYFLTDNPQTSNNILETKISYFSFNHGSENSQIIGVHMAYRNSTGEGVIYVNVNGITVKRCRIDNFIRIAPELSDIYIVENFFSNIGEKTYALNYVVTTYSPPVNLVFNNNICQKTLTWGYPLDNPTTYYPIAQCNNNVFDGPDDITDPSLAFSTSEFKNNILMSSNAVVNIVATAGNVSYNIGTLSTQFGTADNNLVVSDATTLFVTSASPDGAYQIKDGTVADNSGSDGTDRGAFGGTAPGSRYTLSGLAAIPVVYEVTSPGATSTTLPVTIKAKTIK